MVFLEAPTLCILHYNCILMTTIVFFFSFDYEIVISVFWAVDQMYGQTKIFSVEYIVTFL